MLLVDLYFSMSIFMHILNSAGLKKSIPMYLFGYKPIALYLCSMGKEGIGNPNLKCKVSLVNYSIL